MVIRHFNLVDLRIPFIAHEGPEVGQCAEQ
jgi:hypothetical protein